MSKKTREQKIIADLRRQLEQQKPKETFTFKAPVNNTIVDNPSPAPVTLVDYSYVKHDLLKTLILTVLAISVQVVLWYVLGTRK